MVPADELHGSSEGAGHEPSGRNNNDASKRH
jgi:hypothetical protein